MGLKKCCQVFPLSANKSLNIISNLSEPSELRSLKVTQYSWHIYVHFWNAVLLNVPNHRMPLASGKMTHKVHFNFLHGPNSQCVKFNVS